MVYSKLVREQCCLVKNVACIGSLFVAINFKCQFNVDFSDVDDVPGGDEEVM